MKLNRSKDILSKLGNIVHADTQKHGHRIDLTLSEVHKLTGPGSLDFGGSEFREAPSEVVRPQKKQSDDDYGWWSLESGTYIVACNESIELDDSGIAVVTPHPHSLKAGLTVNTTVIDAGATANTETITLLIKVPEKGCNIKENARFASLFLISE